MPAGTAERLGVVALHPLPPLAWNIRNGDFSWGGEPIINANATTCIGGISLQPSSKTTSRHIWTCNFRNFVYSNSSRPWQTETPQQEYTTTIGAAARVSSTTSVIVLMRMTPSHHDHQHSRHPWLLVFTAVDSYLHPHHYLRDCSGRLSAPLL